MAYGKVTRESIERARAALDQLNQRYWKPADGDNVIRIMPPWDENNEWFIEAGRHFSVGPGNKQFDCPRALEPNAECLICDVVRELASTGDPADKEEADDMRAARRWLINVVDLTHPERGVQIWAAGVKAFGELVSYFEDDQWGMCISDPEIGYNIRIKKTGTGKHGTKYAVRVAKDSSPFPYPELLDDLRSPLEALTFSDSEEMRAAYEGLSDNRGAPELPSDDFGDEDEAAPVEEEVPAGFGDFGDDDDQGESTSAPAPAPTARPVRTAPRPAARPARGTAPVPSGTPGPRPLPRAVPGSNAAAGTPATRVRQVLSQEEE